MTILTPIWPAVLILNAVFLVAVVRRLPHLQRFGRLKPETVDFGMVVDIVVPCVPTHRFVVLLVLILLFLLLVLVLVVALFLIELERIEMQRLQNKTVERGTRHGAPREWPVPPQPDRYLWCRL